MNKNSIINFVTNGANRYTALETIINLCVIFVLSLLIFEVYKRTTKRVNYYSNFSIVIMLTAVVTGVIMMIIENNIVLSLGMVGALSIIRFRSAIKDPVDTSYIFWAVAIGISSGTGNHWLSIISSVLIGGFIIFSNKINRAYLKEILIVGGIDIDVEMIKKILENENINYTTKSKSLNKEYQEYIYEINSTSSDQLINMLGAVNGVERVNIVSGVNI